METTLLCLVALVCIIWVLILKHEVDWLKRENAKLKEQLAKHTRVLTGGVQVLEGRRLSRSEVDKLDRGT